MMDSVGDLVGVKITKISYFIYVYISTIER